MKLILCWFLALFVCEACTKKQGTNPELAFSDDAMLDSCRKQNLMYYKNDPARLLAGAAGPHGTFRLRFNSIAFKALTDGGKLPPGMPMPEGSLIVKDVYRGDLYLYAFMYKRSGAWLWGEIESNGKVEYSIKKNPGTCTGCHGQAGNRDMVLSFKHY